ncbi:Pyruvate dehydrogenase E1 component (EC [uncultured Gammaproteobacteria bacterium]|nr:Pyruvate dehydrogenase E1 component (EC [uncultured Gammaproteobacteria bacterium]
MGEAGEGQNTTHSQKKLGLEQVAKFAERFDIPVTKEDVKQLNFYKPAQDSEEMTYMNTQRQKLGGSLPVRSFELENLQAPELDTFSALLKSSGEREMSTTMALNRIMALLVRDNNLDLKSCQSSLMKHAPLVWKACSGSSVFTRLQVNFINQKTLIKSCGTRKTRRGRCCKKALMKPVRF